MIKNCSNCGWNDDGLCDRIGILVDDDDECNKWKTIPIFNQVKELTKCGNLSYHD